MVKGREESGEKGEREKKGKGNFSPFLEDSGGLGSFLLVSSSLCFLVLIDPHRDISSVVFILSMSKAEGLSPFGPLTRHREGDVPPTSSTSSSDSPWVGVDAIDDRGDEYIDEVRIEKSRERNREHAKRTRLRKKALIEGMKGRLLELQQEVRR